MNDLTEDMRDLITDLHTLEEDISDLAAAVETLIASMLIGSQDPVRATELLLAAQVMAAEIHGAIEPDKNGHQA